MKKLIVVLALALAACSSCVTAKSDAPACPPECYDLVRMVDAGVYETIRQPCDQRCYSYTGVGTSKIECEMDCASRAYEVLGIGVDGKCRCKQNTCGRPRNHGGCERLTDDGQIIVPGK